MSDAVSSVAETNDTNPSDQNQNSPKAPYETPESPKTVSKSPDGPSEPSKSSGKNDDTAQKDAKPAELAKDSLKPPTPPTKPSEDTAKPSEPPTASESPKSPHNPSKDTPTDLKPPADASKKPSKSIKSSPNGKAAEPNPASDVKDTKEPADKSGNADSEPNLVKCCCCYCPKTRQKASKGKKPCCELYDLILGLVILFTLIMLLHLVLSKCKYLTFSFRELYTDITMLLAYIHFGILILWCFVFITLIGCRAYCKCLNILKCIFLILHLLFSITLAVLLYIFFRASLVAEKSSCFKTAAIYILIGIVLGFIVYVAFALALRNEMRKVEPGKETRRNDEEALSLSYNRRSNGMISGNMSKSSMTYKDGFYPYYIPGRSTYDCKAYSVTEQLRRDYSRRSLTRTWKWNVNCSHCPQPVNSFATVRYGSYVGKNNYYSSSLRVCEEYNRRYLKSSGQMNETVQTEVGSLSGNSRLGRKQSSISGRQPQPDCSKRRGPSASETKQPYPVFLNIVSGKLL